MIYKLTIINTEGEEIYETLTNDFDNLNDDVRNFKQTPQYIEEHNKEISNLPF
jgi:hypothetical protein